VDPGAEALELLAFLQATTARTTAGQAAMALPAWLEQMALAVVQGTGVRVPPTYKQRSRRLLMGRRSLCMRSGGTGARAERVLGGWMAETVETEGQGGKAVTAIPLATVRRAEMEGTAGTAEMAVMEGSAAPAAPEEMALMSISFYGRAVSLPRTSTCRLQAGTAV
jgi:hypothetical protein